MNQIRNRIEQELADEGVQCSTQAINALYAATAYSSPEIVGCSDSLLLGLLKSGSYTVDALIDSGVNTTHLQEIVTYSVNNSAVKQSCDPVEMLFASQGVFGAFLASFSESSYLETSNLLEIAISPESLDGGSFASWFPIEQSKSPIPSANLLLAIENQVCYVIDSCVELISKNTVTTLSRRHKPLTKAEKEKISRKMSIFWENSEIDWGIFLTNEWLANRHLCIQNSEKTIGMIDRMYGGLRFGSSMFMETGGSFTSLNTSLQVAKRYAPERDQPLLGLIERDGRIYIKKYSYRNSTVFDQDRDGNILSVGAEIPQPLTTLTMLMEFEEILNSPKVNEEKIQKFLEARPEILNSLGYASCKPHVILKEPEKKNLIPDFIMQRPGNNGFDILDLKLPSMKISAISPYLRMSHEITKALAQLRAYRNYFKSPVNTDNFYKTYDLQPLEPELIVVIGRSSEVISLEDRTEIKNQANGLRIISYDELIDCGKARAINMQEMG